MVATRAEALVSFPGSIEQSEQVIDVEGIEDRSLQSKAFEGGPLVAEARKAGSRSRLVSGAGLFGLPQPTESFGGLGQTLLRRVARVRQRLPGKFLKPPLSQRTDDVALEQRHQLGPFEGF